MTAASNTLLGLIWLVKQNTLDMIWILKSIYFPIPRWPNCFKIAIINLRKSWQYWKMSSRSYKRCLGWIIFKIVFNFPFFFNKLFDRDKDGVLSLKEFHGIARRLGLHLNFEQVNCKCVSFSAIFNRPRKLPGLCQQTSLASPSHLMSTSSWSPTRGSLTRMSVPWSTCSSI